MKGFPDHLPALPAVPVGFSRWVYRGVKFASRRAIMVTSYDEKMDTHWDPPVVFQTCGDEHTHYAEAVMDHHAICECRECNGEARDEEPLTSMLHDFVAEHLEGRDVFDIAAALMTTAQGFIASSVPAHEQQGVYEACLRQMKRNWPKVRVVFHHTAE